MSLNGQISQPCFSTLTFQLELNITDKGGNLWKVNNPRKCKPNIKMQVNSTLRLKEDKFIFN